MRNVFVSYSHRLDQDVVDEFRRKFGNDKMVFSDCSLENKDLSHLSDDTIKNNYIRPQLRLSSVTIVLLALLLRNAEGVVSKVRTTFCLPLALLTITSRSFSCPLCIPSNFPIVTIVFFNFMLSSKEMRCIISPFL